ncbi:MAG TPA: sensor histidine kinase, partial [Puia sp.]
YNLLYNAALYTPPGTPVFISATRFARELVLVVEDDGPGFPEEEIDKVFEKFYRRGRTGGAGLGLSIVKGFVEAHNGTIELTNRASGGACFIISLPACFSVEAAQEEYVS